MADLNARIIAKASATAAEEPLSADLEVAELAVNTADGKLFTKHTDGSVVTISGGSGGGASSLGGLDDVELIEATAGEMLILAGSNWTNVTVDKIVSGGGTSTAMRLDFDDPSADIPVLLAGTMTTTYPSSDAKFGTGGATFSRSNQDYLQGDWGFGLLTDTWTFSFWIKTSDTDYSSTTGKRIIAPVSGTNLGSGFQILRDSAGGDTYTPWADNLPGAITLTSEGNAETYCASTRTTQVTDGAWHFIVFQHEGSGVYSCFVDGNLTERRARSVVNFERNGGFFIGKRQDLNALAYLSASLDNMVLTPGFVMSTGATLSVPGAPLGETISYGSGTGIDMLNDV